LKHDKSGELHSISYILYLLLVATDHE